MIENDVIDKGSRCSMKYDSTVVSSIANYLGFKNVHPKGSQVQFTCPFAEFDDLSGHQHGDLKNPSFFVSSCPTDNNYTRWSCPVCEHARYQYSEFKQTTDSFLNPKTHSGYDIVKRSYRTEGFLATLTNIYTHYGYTEKASKARTLWLEYISDHDDADSPAYAFDPEAEYIQKEFYYFPESWLSSFVSVANVPKALAYIEARGVDPKVAIYLDMRFDSEKNMICIPMRDYETKDITGMRGRSINYLLPKHESHNWYKYSVMYEGVKAECGSKDPWVNEDRIDFNKPVVVVEGLFDFLKVASFYPNVIAICNKTVAGSKLARIKHVHSLVWLTDKGSAETDRVAVEKRCKHLGIDIHHVFIPAGHNYIELDGSTHDVKDAGALSHQILKPLVLNAVENAITIKSSHSDCCTQ